MGDSPATDTLSRRGCQPWAGGWAHCLSVLSFPVSSKPFPLMITAVVAGVAGIVAAAAVAGVVAWVCFRRRQSSGSWPSLVSLVSSSLAKALKHCRTLLFGLQNPGQTWPRVSVLHAFTTHSFPEAWPNSFHVEHRASAVGSTQTQSAAAPLGAHRVAGGKTGAQTDHMIRGMGATTEMRGRGGRGWKSPRNPVGWDVRDAFLGGTRGGPIASGQVSAPWLTGCVAWLTPQLPCP